MFKHFTSNFVSSHILEYFKASGLHTLACYHRGNSLFLGGLVLDTHTGLKSEYSTAHAELLMELTVGS